MQIKEIMEKTGVVIVGLVSSVNEFINKENRSFWSVDMQVKGCKSLVNVKLPQGYPINTLQEYELVKIPVFFKPNFNRTGIVIEALPPVK